jgi:hypothetical protein
MQQSTYAVFGSHRNREPIFISLEVRMTRETSAESERKARKAAVDDQNLTTSETYPRPASNGGKKHAEQTLRRRLALAAMLPDGGQAGIGVTALTRKLNTEGYQCVRRTVERDLAEIAEGSVWREVGIDIVSSPDPSNAQASLWTHRTPARPLMLRLPAGEDALLVGLLAQELHAFIPASAVQALSYYQQSTGRLRHWPGREGHVLYQQKIRNLPDGPTMSPPPLDAIHLRDVNEALLRNEQISLRYAAASRTGEGTYRLHPIGMVKKGKFFWLVAAKYEQGRVVKAPRTFRMDRVRRVERHVNEPVARDLPTLQEVLDSGALEFFPSGIVKLVLRSRPGRSGDQLMVNYTETPLSKDQQIVELHEGGQELRATVPYTRELVWMLQSQAHLLRVVAPESLLEELRGFAAEAAAHYDVTAGACRDRGMCS